MLRKVIYTGALICATFFAGGNALAENLFSDNSNISDKAYMECQYKYSYAKDTLNLDIRTEDRMLLLIGKNTSKFYSYNTYLADSSMQADVAKKVDIAQIMANTQKYRGGEQEIIYKNVDNLCTTNKIVRDYFKIEEPTVQFNWNIEEDSPNNSMEILGYNCRKATCNFRGRNYIAWFTSEVAVSNGPWKFSGLPGLIMKIQDFNNHYKWEIVGIKSVNELSIVFENRQYINSTREKFAKTLKKFQADPIGYMNTVSGIKITVTGSDGKPMSDEGLKKTKITVNMGDSVTSTEGAKSGYNLIERY